MKCKKSCKKPDRYILINCGAVPITSSFAHHLGKTPINYNYLRGDFDRVVGEIMWGPGALDYDHPTTKVKLKRWFFDKATGVKTNKWLFNPSDVELV